jgi:biopolymer transport protein ExbD
MATKISQLTGVSEDCKMDSSSMIDMVFQLLLFFMVSSRMITNQIDPNVEIPVAANARPPEQASGRIVINIYDDGRFSAGKNQPLADMEAITEYVQREREGIDAGTTPKIMLRGHRTALVKYSKQVVQGAGAAGVNTIIFSAFPSGKKYK